MKTYDVIVLGVGGVGSAAAYHLARAGVRVLGIDRNLPPHNFGSSHGETRVIRQAYFEHPDYVPLLLESYREWEALEQISGQSLLHQVGLIEVGPPDGVVVPGVLRSAKEHNLVVERLSSQEIEARWPGIRVGEDLVGIFEPTAGYLLVEECVRTHLVEATVQGAELLLDTEVVSWEANNYGVTVTTRAGVFHAERLVVTAGAWAHSILEHLRLNLEVRRKSLFWFESPQRCYEVSAGFPTFLFELPQGVFYGFPQLNSRGVKIAEHSGGSPVKDPSQVDRGENPAERQRLADFAAEYLPALSANVLEHTVCLYTMSPDEHFIIDRHPEHPQVVYVAGLSGHGFKFASALGRVSAELALERESSLPIEFLRADRFS